MFSQDKTFMILVNDLLSLYSKSLDDETLNQFAVIIDNSEYKESNVVKTTAYLINKKATLRRISSILKERTIDEEVSKKLIKK